MHIYCVSFFNIYYKRSLKRRLRDRP